MHGRTLQWCKVQKVVGVRELCHTHCDVMWLVFCSKLPFKFHVLLDVKLSVRTELVDLPTAASTAPAFEPPLLALSGPTAVLNPGETSCPACETPRLAAKTKRKKRDKLTLLTCRHELHIKVLRHFWGLSTGVGDQLKTDPFVFLTGCCWLRRRLRSCGLAPGFESLSIGPWGGACPPCATWLGGAPLTGGCWFAGTAALSAICRAVQQLNRHKI